MSAAEIVDAVTGLLWPLLIAAVVWRLLPTIKDIIGSRGFTVKAAGVEIGVQELSDQLARGSEDLREQVSALKRQLAAIDGAPDATESPIARGLPRLQRILWVDDHPENNFYEIQALTAKGVSVELASSTSEGLAVLGAAQVPYDAVITDMGRTEDGHDRPSAGLDLMRALSDEGIDMPVVVYASAPAIARHAQRIREAGGRATASATELMEILGELGLR